MKTVHIQWEMSVLLFLYYESSDFDPKAVLFLLKVVLLLKGCKNLFPHIQKKYWNSLDVYVTGLLFLLVLLSF